MEEMPSNKCYLLCSLRINSFFLFSPRLTVLSWWPLAYEQERGRSKKSYLDAVFLLGQLHMGALLAQEDLNQRILRI